MAQGKNIVTSQIKEGEGRSILFKHDMALSYFLEQYFGEIVDYTRSSDPKLTLFSHIRVESIRILKIGLMTIKKIKFRKNKVIPSLDSLFLIRSLASKSSIKSFFDEDKSDNKIMLRDITLNKIFSESSEVSELYNYFSFSEFITSLKCKIETKRIPKELDIKCLGITIVDDLEFSNSRNLSYISRINITCSST